MRQDPTYESLLMTVAQDVAVIRQAATRSLGYVTDGQPELAAPCARECFEQTEVLVRRLAKHGFHVDHIPEVHELLARLEGLYDLAGRVDEQLVGDATGEPSDRRPDLTDGLMLLVLYLRCVRFRDDAV